MPLNLSQQQFVDTIADDFFSDLPTEEKALHTTLETFKQAIQKKLPDSDDLIYFQNGLHNPKLYFRTIEEKEYNANITVGDVQDCLFKLTMTRLKAAAEQANLPWNDAEWKLLWQPFTHAPLYNERFTSEKFAVSGDSPQDEPYRIKIEDRLFKATLYPRDEFRLVQLIIDIKLEQQKSLTVDIIDYPAELQGEQDKDEFVNQLLLANETVEFAEKKSRPIIMNELIHKKILTKKEGWEASPDARNLMTYQIYYILVKNKLIPFDLIKKINNDQFKILTSPFMIRLIENMSDPENIVPTIQKMLACTAFERSVLLNPFYQSGVQSEQFDERDFLGVNEQESKNLNSIPIMNLIRDGKITVLQARSLSIEANQLLSDPYFFELVKNSAQETAQALLAPHMVRVCRLDTEHLTSQNADFLLKNSYARFFVETGFLRMNELAFIPRSDLTLTLPDTPLDFDDLDCDGVRRVIVEFINYAKVDLLNESDLSVLYPNLPLLFNSNSNDCFNKLNEDSLNTFKNTLSHMNAKARLEALQKETPITLHDGKPDSLEKLISTCSQFNIDFESIVRSFEPKPQTPATPKIYLNPPESKSICSSAGHFKKPKHKKRDAEFLELAITLYKVIKKSRGMCAMS